MQETSTFPNIKARVFIDERFKKNGTGLQIPTFSDVFMDGQIYFAQSSSIYPIQLADFAAFSLNRVQLLGSKKQRSTLEQSLLKNLSPVAFNYINIEQKVVSVERQGPIISLADTRPHGLYSTKTS